MDFRKEGPGKLFLGDFITLFYAKMISTTSFLLGSSIFFIFLKKKYLNKTWKSLLISSLKS